MKTRLNCDQVFDRLTCGPFPGGGPDDGAVELHLGACHECRQLAEALRPAVDLFHAAADPSSLPVYRGRLPALLDAAAPALGPIRDATGGGPRPSHEQRYSVVLVAALLLGVLGGVWGSREWRQGEGRPRDRAPQLDKRSVVLRDVDLYSTGEGGLEWTLGLCAECSTSGDAFVAPWVATQGQCCTACHSAQTPRSSQFVVSRFMAACLLCHKG